MNKEKILLLKNVFVKKIQSWFFHLSSDLRKKFYSSLAVLQKSSLYKKLSPFIDKYLEMLFSYFHWLFKRFPFLRRLSGSFEKKHFSFLFLALLCSLGIFYFMSVLISTGKNPKLEQMANVQIQFLMNAKMEDLELRSRRIPKKPEEEEAPPEQSQVPIQDREMEAPQMDTQLPRLELPDNFQSDSKGAGVSGQMAQNQDVSPIFRVNPIYPRRAALQNVEGFVILQFDITELGLTDKVKVLRASPPQIFNSSAIQAVRKWKYTPYMENGKPRRLKGIKVQLNFGLSK